GTKPAEGALSVLLQSAIKTKDQKGAIVALQKMVEYYPKPERWRDLLVLMRDSAGRSANDEEYTLNIYRLMRETGTLKDGNEFVEMATIALKRGSPGEASDAIKRGTAANALSTGGNKTASDVLRKSAEVAEKADRATLAKFETEAKSAKTGEADVRLGQAFLSYDQPDKALEALQRGIQKGSLRNPDEAQILLGMTYLKLGQKAEAQAAFSAGKGQDQKFGDLAQLWAIYARS
ncbi:MAG: tetratricopeptide repeat protein, partial [Steroidobacteraceae bacterium]